MVWPYPVKKIYNWARRRKRRKISKIWKKIYKESSSSYQNVWNFKISFLSLPQRWYFSFMISKLYLSLSLWSREGWQLPVREYFPSFPPLYAMSPSVFCIFDMVKLSWNYIKWAEKTHTKNKQNYHQLCITDSEEVGTTAIKMLLLTGVTRSPLPKKDTKVSKKAVLRSRTR